MTARPEEVRHCIKCGREIGADESICAACNRAGMATPSATQYHGTVAVAIIAAVAALAVAASLSLRGIGPWGATVRAVAPATPSGVEVTFDVANEGTRQGRAKCRLVALGAAGERLGTAQLVTAPIAGGATLEVTGRIPGLETLPDRVSAECS